MSAEVLRRVASLMRERAEASFAEGSADEEPWYNIKLDGRLLTKWDSFAAASPTDAEHVASWHPAVALAVADWLDSEADAYDTCLAKQADPERRFQSLWTATANARHDHALTVARAYLGEAS